MEKPPGNKPLLTEKQKNLIRFTWNKLETNMEEVGSMVFGRIFNRNPEVKALFPFKGVYGEALRNHPVFTSHAYRSVICDTSTLIVMSHNGREVVLVIPKK